MLATDPGGPKHHRRAQPLVEPVDPRAAAAAAECHLHVRTPCPAPAPTSSPWSPPRCQNDSLRRLWRVNASLLESQPSRSILLLGSSLDRNALAFLCEAAGAMQQRDAQLVDAVYGAFWCSFGGLTVAWALLFGSEPPPYWKLPGYMVGKSGPTVCPKCTASSHDFIRVNATAFAKRAFQSRAPSVVVIATSNWDLSSWWRAGGTRPRFRPPERRFATWCNHSLPSVLHATQAAFPDSRVAFRTAPVPYGEEPGRAAPDFERMATCARAAVPRLGHELVDWHADVEAMRQEGAQLDVLYPQPHESANISDPIISLAHTNHIHPGPAASLRLANLMYAHLLRADHACVRSSAYRPNSAADDHRQTASHRAAACEWLSTIHGLAGSVHGGGLLTVRGEHNQTVRWDRTVLSEPHLRQIDAPDYAQRYLPTCFAPPHAPHTTPRALSAMLEDAAAMDQVNELAAIDSALQSEAATHMLNSLRLSIGLGRGHDGARVLHPRGEHVALCVTSITPSTPKVARMLRRMAAQVDFFGEARLFVTLQIIDQPTRNFSVSELQPLVAGGCRGPPHFLLLCAGAHVL